MKGRDSARTPFQWNRSRNAGFTSGTPWIMVNPNYPEINAEEQLSRPDSVYAFYQKLIRLRHKNEIVISGRYTGLAVDDPAVFAYTRTLGDQVWLVICNFTDQETEFDWTSYLKTDHPDIILGNLDDTNYPVSKVLQPYEAVILA